MKPLLLLVPILVAGVAAQTTGKADSFVAEAKALAANDRTALATRIATTRAEPHTCSKSSARM
jgi:hypothetical protein